MVNKTVICGKNDFICGIGILLTIRCLDNMQDEKCLLFVGKSTAICGIDLLR